MPNKVKPFFIRITDDMTPHIIQDALDKCVDAGATEKERADREWLEKMEYFGVCGQDGTYFSVDSGAYFNAQEITLDQLDEWLGVAGESQDVVEWDGEGLPPVGVECELKYKHASNADWRPCRVFAYSNEMGIVAAIWHWTDDMWKHATVEVDTYRFRKIETLEQKAERERLEVVNDVCEELFGDTAEECREDVVGTVYAMVRAGYRKQ